VELSKDILYKVTFIFKVIADRIYAIREKSRKLNYWLKLNPQMLVDHRSVAIEEKFIKKNPLENVYEIVQKRRSTYWYIVCSDCINKSVRPDA